jgi:hypothetical protein
LSRRRVGDGSSGRLWGGMSVLLRDRDLSVVARRCAASGALSELMNALR